MFTPDQAYWISLIGIILGCLAIGYGVGYVCGYKCAVDEWATIIDDDVEAIEGSVLDAEVIQ